MNILADERVVCTGPGCGSLYVMGEGWSGLCPSCSAFSEEHLFGLHDQDADGCPHCC